ncbi:radical SAM protein [Geobacter sp.]|uniref:B12-binding domain-containing radical SAM protein n=1 Tax=Geobacter sp. TaxID=46610 RepID=UPI00262778ED|nr:radical SAM protein [Geobacter sp.]
MRILLLYKSHPAGARDPFTSLLPTGLGYIGAYLRGHGFDPVLANLSGSSWANAEELLARERPDLVCISQFTHNRFESLKLAALAKKLRPSCVTLLGGPHATHTFAAILEGHPEVDAVVLGEGEETVLDVARMVAAGGREFSALQGVAFRGGGGIRSTCRPPLVDLDGLPFPVHGYEYSEGCDIRRQLQFIITSRGCPASCRFCSSPLFWGKSLRFRSPRSMVDEIRLLRDRYGLIYFSLRDDTFTARADRVVEFCRLMLDEQVHILWNCQSRVNCVDEEMLLWMRRAGCECIQYGVESGSEKVLAMLGKRITPEQVRRAARATRQAGISLSIYLITGVPGETEDDVQATVRLMDEILPHDGQVAPLAYYPGTALFADAVREGRVPGDLFERQRGEAFYVRSDPFVARASETLLRAIDRVGRRARFGPADFDRQRQILGYCHATALAQGEWHEEHDDFGSAESVYREITERQPGNPWGWLALGGLYGGAGLVEQGVEMFRRAQAIVPAHLPASLALGDLLLMAGDRKGARRHYERARELDPRDGEVRERLKKLGACRA